MSFREGTGKCSSSSSSSSTRRRRRRRRRRPPLRPPPSAEQTATGPPALPASAFGRASVGPDGSSPVAAERGAVLPPLRMELMTRTGMAMGMGMPAARTALGEKQWRGATGMEVLVGTFRWANNTLVIGVVVIGRTDTVPEMRGTIEIHHLPSGAMVLVVGPTVLMRPRPLSEPLNRHFATFLSCLGHICSEPLGLHWRRLCQRLLNWGGLRGSRVQSFLSWPPIEDEEER